MHFNTKPLRLDFETGDLSFWTAEGDAFVDQPVRGDKIRASHVRPGLVPLGGDYWDGPYPVGHQGDYWISTENHLTGTLISGEFFIDANYPWFSFLIGGGDDIDNLRVELLIKATAENRNTFAYKAEPGEERVSYALVTLVGRGDFYRAFAATGHNSEVMRRVVLNVIETQLVGEQACIRIVDNSTHSHLNADDFCFSADAPKVAPLAEGGGDISAPVWGFADLHTHPMAALAFGGKLFWGEPDGPAETALSPCTPAHGMGGTGIPSTQGVGNILLSFFEGTGYRPLLQNVFHPGHHVGGYPQFDGWPKFTTLIHQQMYIDWVKRAYEGGLRLLVAHVVNNQLLAHEFGGHGTQAPADDRSAVEQQIGAMKEFASRHADWMEIAYSPTEARRIIRQNKLAIVLGVEVDSLGNWKHADDCTDDKVRAYLQYLYNDLGVRHLFPVHIANNAFGGAAIYNDMFGVVNRFLRDDYLQVEDGSESGVQFRLGENPGPAVAWYQSPVGINPPRLGPYYAPPDYHKVPGGHVNVAGLTPRGRFLIEEMMCLGMLIDVDHMSHKATNETLAMAEQRDYPVVSGHTEIQELAWRRAETASIHKCPSEFKKTPQQLARIRQLGGIIAPIINQGDNRAVGEVLPQLTGKVSANCAGSATAWAYAYLYAVEKMGGRGVGIGTDTNGFNKLPGPRFGLNAGYYLHNYLPGIGEDRQRQALRREQVEEQTNGVCYDTPLKDLRYYRFEGVLEGEVYDSLERAVWRAIAVHAAGLDPWHDPQRIPDHTDQVEHLAKGFCAGSDAQLLRPNPFNIGTGDAPWEQRAAFLVKTGQSPHDLERDPERVHVLYEKIMPIWRKWHAMQGSNVPLKRSFSGQRDFDINLDGMAHYGMLPDFLQDVKNVGLTDEDLLPLFRSAEEYIRVWEKCERKRGNNA